MSMPNFPSTADMSREEVINQVISSIAMEELGLSHILNAEGEKLQYALGTLTGASGLNPTVEELLQINESVQQLLSTTMQNQMFLQNKMSSALNAATMQGPTGATGSTGVTGPAGGPIGPTGVTGATGAEPVVTISAAGNWTVDGVDLGVSAIGATGNMPAIAVDAAGNWTVDGVDIGVSAVGATGATGATGPSGAGMTTGAALFNAVSVVNGVTGTEIPVAFGNQMIFTTDTPDIINIAVDPGSTRITIDSLAGGATGATGATGPAIGLTGVGGGAIVNFQNGIVDWANPLTWPIALDVLQIGDIESQLTNIENTLTTATGLAGLLGVDPTILEPLFVPVVGVLTLLMTPLTEAIDAITLPLNALFPAGGTLSGLASTDAYIGHANVGLVPALTGSHLPALSLVAGPPYPQVIARDGLINSFAAEFDTLIGLDLQLDNALEGLIQTLNTALGTLGLAVSAIAGALATIAVDLPSNYQELINGLAVPILNDGTTTPNLEMHAVLWVGKPVIDPLTTFAEAGVSSVTWDIAADLNLGAINFAQLAPLDTFAGSITSIVVDLKDALSTLLSLFSTQGANNEIATNTPFNAAHMDVPDYTVFTGDYIMVQFTVAGSDGTVVLAGVAAPNAMASISIEEV